VRPDRTAPVLLAGAVPPGQLRNGSPHAGAGGAATSAHAYTRAHPQVCARAHPRACAQVYARRCSRACAQRCSRACAQVAGRSGDRRARWPLSLTVPICCYGSRSLRLRVVPGALPRSSSAFTAHPSLSPCLRAPPSSLYWRFPCRCFSPLLLFSFFVCLRPLRAPRPLLYPFPVVLSASACCSS
jgi:hypothetical protein